MSKDQMIGVLILLGAIVVLGIYGYMIFLGEFWQRVALLVVATVAVVGVMGIIAWIGWTMASTPPPTPIESIEEKTTPEVATTDEKKERIIFFS